MIDLIKKILNKLATLAIIVVLFYFGSKLILNNNDFSSTSFISGGIILVVAITLSLIFFLDYRYKEYTDNTIKQLSEANDSLLKIIKSKGKTDQALEKATKKAFDNFGKTETEKGSVGWSGCCGHCSGKAFNIAA